MDYKDKLTRCKDIVAAASARFVNRRTKEYSPYLAPLMAALRRTYVESGDSWTMAVSDKWELIINIDFTLALFDGDGIEGVSFVLGHELWHVALRHCHRKPSFQTEMDHKLWGVACDMAINSGLVAAGWKAPTVSGRPFLPGDFGFPEAQTSHEYFDLLKKLAGNQQQQAQNQQGVNQGSACGTGADGNASPGEKHGKSAGDGVSPARQGAVMSQVQAKLKETAEKSRGTIPAGFELALDEALEPPKLPWQDILAHLIGMANQRVAGFSDFAFDAMSKRQASQGYGPGACILPHLVDYLPKIAVILDTSGSMCGELAEACAEIQGVLDQCRGSLRFISCDADVHEDIEARTIQDVLANIKGGGGTDMRPAFAKIQESGNMPDLTICVTDGHIGDPGTEPEFPVIWVTSGAKEFPWGEVVDISD